MEKPQLGAILVRAKQNLEGDRDYDETKASNFI